MLLSKSSPFKVKETQFVFIVIFFSLIASIFSLIIGNLCFMVPVFGVSF